MNMTLNGHALISLHPSELKFNFELEKQCYCDLKVVNNTEHHVAFKVKTTSPKKYFVRPNTSVIQPWDVCFIRVTLQAQQEYPPDMQSKDKFLIQGTVVPRHTDINDLSADTFNKEAGKLVEEFKLKVVYVFSNSTQDNKEDDAYKSSKQSLDDSVQAQALVRIRNERDEAIRHTQQLQKELERLKRQRYRKNNSGFSVTIAVFVLIIGIILGFLSRFLFSSSSTE